MAHPSPLRSSVILTYGRQQMTALFCKHCSPSCILLMGQLYINCRMFDQMLSILPRIPHLLRFPVLEHVSLMQILKSALNMVAPDVEIEDGKGEKLLFLCQLKYYEITLCCNSSLLPIHCITIVPS